MQDDPRYDDVVAEVADWLCERVERRLRRPAWPASASASTRASASARTWSHNLSLIAHVDVIGGRCGTPVLIGLSRKSFLGRIMGDMERDRHRPHHRRQRRGRPARRVHAARPRRRRAPRRVRRRRRDRSREMSDNEREVEIAIDGLAVFAHHGALPEEQALGQRFFLDIRMIPLRDAACDTDELADAIDYGAVAQRAHERRRRRAVPPARAPGRRGRGRDHRRVPGGRGERAGLEALRAGAARDRHRRRHRHPPASPVSGHVAIGLGANLGDPLAALRAAIDAIDALPTTRALVASDVYLTAPVGGPPGQPDYANAALLVETSLAPRALLRELQRIELEAGRVRTVRVRPAHARPRHPVVGGPRDPRARPAGAAPAADGAAVRARAAARGAPGAPHSPRRSPRCPTRAFGDWARSLTLPLERSFPTRGERRVPSRGPRGVRRRARARAQARVRDGLRAVPLLRAHAGGDVPLQQARPARSSTSRPTRSST